MKVLVVAPPNSNTAIEGAACTVTNPQEHSDWANYPHLGVLALVSALRPVPGIEPEYLDGTILPWQELLKYVEDHAGEILALCITALTATYEAGLQLCAAAKNANENIVTIMGNDHVTALTAEVSSLRAGQVDYIFTGNEVVGRFVGLIAALRAGAVAKTPGVVQVIGSSPGEPVYTSIDHSAIDRTFRHSAAYRKNFAGRIAPALLRLTGRTFAAGVPVEIGRGCVKFAQDDACSFCSIQHAGVWRNSIRDAATAWNVISDAHRAGYDYLYLTADELPLTFGKLLREMQAETPGWWREMAEDERPAMVGYARADGLENERNAALLRGLGIRQVMVGLDAGSPISLRALRKPLSPRRDPAPAARAEKLFESNVRALSSAKNTGLVLKVGFVLGHLGMSHGLLRENVDMMNELLTLGAGSITSVDVEVLSPEPGSLDFRTLLSPDLASARASRLGLPLPTSAPREQLAGKWRGKDVIDRESAMADYVTAVMPGLTMADLAEARSAVRTHAADLGLTIGS
ncbi:hypothetical protein [Amycolatopsis sp. NPDC051102]|uniref:B12-binding domain-containing radical SAM protein n=1 Tax=Amycolatopsis sp. NPDC051102 TaxID=3155163 RepID=UPI00341DEA29